MTTRAPLKPTHHKRRQVADSLRQMIGSLTPGDRLPSVTQLEQHFSVAKSTVELAIGDLRAEGLLVRRQGSGTFVAERPSPIPIDRKLATHSGLIVLTAFASSTIFVPIVEAVEAEMQKTGQTPVLLLEEDAGQRLRRIAERCEQVGADGYIHVGSLGQGPFPAFPGVVIGEIPSDAPVHQVVVDNEGGGQRIGEYLWRLGHRRVGCLGPGNLIPSVPRFRGLCAAFAERGGDHPVLFEGGLTWNGLLVERDGRQLATMLAEWLALPEPPTALFCTNDVLALATVRALDGMGVRVPEDISVVGFDDAPHLRDVHHPPLTTIRMPCAALGSLAVQTLSEALERPDLPLRRLRLSPEFIIRESATMPSVRNEVPSGL